jgi:hypothetical protein
MDFEFYATGEEGKSMSSGIQDYCHEFHDLFDAFFRLSS